MGPTVEFSGTLSQYVPATKKQAGSITISIAGASIPGYAGTIATLTITKQTKIVTHGKIHDGDLGTVKIQYGDAVPLHPSLTVPVSLLTDLS